MYYSGERYMITKAPITDIDLLYEDALLYCAFCRHNGHSDWRMPTHSEYLNDDISGWYVDRPNGGRSMAVTPVRDIC